MTPSAQLTQDVELLRGRTNLVSRTSGQNTVWIEENRTGIKTLTRTVIRPKVDLDTMVHQQIALDSKVDGIQTNVDKVEAKVDGVETKVDKLK